MVKYLFTLIISIFFMQTSFAVCDGLTDPNKLMNCYTSEYIQLEQRLAKLENIARKLLNSADMRQMQHALSLWKQYMVEQCEFESRLYEDNILLRQTATAICRYRMLKSHSKLIASTLKKFGEGQEPTTSTEDG